MKKASGISKKGVVLSDEMRMAATPLPCGNCLPCRINKSRVLTNRILLEQTQHKMSCFATLTYSDECLPDYGWLNYRDLELFLKRLRKRRSPKKVRYFAAGEYGDRSLRPHFHIILFGLDRMHKPLIESCWGMGLVDVGELNNHSARYVAGYVTKGMHYFGSKKLESKGLKVPEVRRMSKGLGKEAIKEMANTLLNKPYFKKMAIRELNYGKNKKLPLGRFLTEKMAEYIGISEEELRATVWDFQQEIFEKHLDDISPKFYQNIVNEDEAKRIRQKKLRKIYKQKRSI